MTDFIIAAILAVLIVVGIIYTRKHFKHQSGCCGGGGNYVSKKKLKNVVAKKTLVIEGMTCENCKARVERYLNDMVGVSATVNLKRKEAVVSMDRHIDDEQFKAAIEKAGYQLTEIK